MSERFKAAAQTVSVLLLSLWLGAALFFSAIVAPTVFGVLRSFQLPNANEIAGAIVSRSLAVINTGGFAISLVLLIILFVLKLTRNRAWFLVGVISLVIMSIMTGLGQWVISARMLALRTAMKLPLDQMARDDPQRVAFDGLHHYSVAALGLAMVSALVAIIALTQQRRHSD